MPVFCGVAFKGILGEQGVGRICFASYSLSFYFVYFVPVFV